MVSLNSNAEKHAYKTLDLPLFKQFSLTGVKEKVSNILDMIGRVEGLFSTYTIHNISHVDEMLNTLDWLIPLSTQKEMTPVDWLLTVLSIYLHDLGMVVTSDEYCHRMDNPKFQEFLQSLNKDIEGKDYLARTEKMSADEKERFFYQEYVRDQHATRISEWIKGDHSNKWNQRVKPVAEEIAKILSDLPPRFRNDLAVICESHHKDNLDKDELFPLCRHYGNNPKELGNVQYSAILLRTSDLLHVTKDRTPSVMYKILRLSDPKGVDEWEKQIGTFSVHMQNREFNPNDHDTHVIVIGADFTEERPFFALTEYISFADSQVKQSKRWADMSQKKHDGKNYSFPWHTIKGDIRVEGNEPVTMSFELDRGRLLDLLVGHTIYNDPTVAIRELLQNAIDAVRFQYHLNEKDGASMGSVNVNWDSEKLELIVEDNGIGMDSDVIKFNLMRVGSSFYDTPKFQSEHADFTPISRFGIGILTCFMISDDIEIITSQQNGGYRIRMSSVHADYLVKKLEPGNLSLKGLEPHGTRVILKLRSSIDLKERSMFDIVRYWIILPACRISYSENGQKPQLVGFGNPVDALRYFQFKDSSEKLKNEDSYEIIKSAHSEDCATYELVFAVRKRFTPERNFIEGKADAPAVCIEGIRADNALPGFSKVDFNRYVRQSGNSPICALLSVRGNKRFRTTVSRTTLEKDAEYNRVGEICMKLLFDHIENEVRRISEQKGKPLSQASTAGLWIYKFLERSINNPSLINYLHIRNSKLPLLVVEKTENERKVIRPSRELINSEQLKKFEKFWTIESRLVDYLGVISRDLGREVSLNEFLSTLAPEFQDLRITPVISDAYQFSDLILLSHKVAKVEFSRKNQQTKIEWELKEDISSDTYNIMSLFNEEAGSLVMRNMLKNWDTSNSFPFKNISIAVAPIEGDLNNVWGIQTRIIPVLNQMSKAAEVWTTLKDSIAKMPIDTKLEEISLLCNGCLILKLVFMQHRPGYYQIPGKSELHDKWNSLSIQINQALEEMAIEKRIPENFEDIFEDEELFDASRYWMNWMENQLSEYPI